MKSGKIFVASLLGLLAGNGFDLNGLPDSKAAEVSEDDKAFLKTLKGAKRDIWSRRVYRGLTASKRKFFDNMKKEQL